MSGKKLIFKVPDEINTISAKTFLKKHCMVSTRMITRLKREKDGILRDGKILRTVDILRGGDEVVLNLPEDKSDIVPVKRDLRILYEDDYLIAIDKPRDMTVHPTKIYQLNTLANYLAFYQNEKGESYTFRVINRLDRDTSGIVVVAKDKYTAKYLSENMSKTYMAVCEGVIEQSGTIDKPIRLLEGHTVQRTIADDGARAVTHYTPIKSCNNHTLLSIRLETGRTHQIRCHFSGTGHPLAGDDMYGGSLRFITRQALHCNSVTFNHPVTKKTVVIKSELPEDFLNIINETG